MKITKIENPPKEDKLFEGANYPVEQELNQSNPKPQKKKTHSHYYID